MADIRMQRKLRAIFSADVKGYSRLMGDDDEHTINTITAYRKIITGLIETNHGRVVDAPGDNILAEFSGALNAVTSAIEIQQTLETQNSNLPDNRRMVFRIGINLGDIVHKEDRIYGDGVNVAARIESLADPGGICISRGVFDQVKRKVRHGFEYLGEHSVKNIPESIRIYRVLLSPEFDGKVIGEPVKQISRLKRPYAIATSLILIFSAALLLFFYPRQPDLEPASVEKMAYPLPDQPSIAVLPFDNMSGDPDQEYFSDGITEHIITWLSKVPYILVIARNSTFAYKNKHVKVQQIAEELGVRYILEGSVQRSDNRVRITAQLVDALKGHHLWAESYDRKLEDVFRLQDEIAMKIMAEMQVELTVDELGRLSAIKTKNIKAYEKYLIGL
jgi:adenylate cyclase